MTPDFSLSLQPVLRRVSTRLPLSFVALFTAGLLAACPPAPPSSDAGEDPSPTVSPNDDAGEALVDAGLQQDAGEASPDAGTNEPDAALDDAGNDAGSTTQDAGSTKDAGNVQMNDAGTLGTVTLCELSEAFFEPKCVQCHNATGTFPDLTYPALQNLNGLSSQLFSDALLVPGDPDASLLHRKVAQTQAGNEGDRMPPQPNAPATADEVTLLETWISQGADTRCAPPPVFDPGDPPDVAGPVLLELHFDEAQGQIAADTSGNNRNARLGANGDVDNFDPSWQDGAVAGGLRFDNNDFAAVADFPPSTSVTVMAWIRYRGAPADAIDHMIVDKGNQELNFRLGNGHLSAGLGGENLTDETFNFTSAENEGQWFHVAYAFDDDANTQKLFRDGVEVASGVHNGSIVDTDYQLWVGRHSQFDFGSFSGDIDEVRVVGRALSGSEVAQWETYERQFVDYTAPVDCSMESGLDVYRRRIEPLVTGGQPSSCNQCHLSGTGLTAFVQDTPCESMACLAAQGLVDLDNPAESSILDQILLAQPDSALITSAVIDAEHDGFLEWITWSAQCQQQICGDIPNACSSGTGNTTPGSEVQGPLGACEESMIVDSFSRMVFSSITRCSGCHDAEGQRFQEGTMFIDADSAMNTMYNMVGAGIIDVDSPQNSLLLLKPLDPDEGGVPHAGGPKFANEGDPSYVFYRNWLELYSVCTVNGDQGTLPELPVVGILNVQDNTEVTSPTPLYGYAVDAQDGLLDGPDVQWRVDGDLIGQGVTLEDVNIASGNHVLTLEATDSDNNVVTLTRNISVP